MCFGGGAPKTNYSPQTDAANTAAMNRQNDLLAQQIAEQKRQDDAARAEANDKSARLKQGTDNINNAFSNYDQNYYQGLANKYSDFYLPQLADQGQTAQQQLLYGLARQGILNSSAKGYEYGQLQKQYGLQQQGILSNAQAYSNNAKQQIENQRSNLLSQLNATGGDKVTSAGFLGGSSANAVGSYPISAPVLQSFSPLGDLFQNVSSVAANDARVSNATGRPGFLQTAFNNVSGGNSSSGSSSKYVN